MLSFSGAKITASGKLSEQPEMWQVWPLGDDNDCHLSKAAGSRDMEDETELKVLGPLQSLMADPAEKQQMC